jgi:hypothetical protein
MRSLTVLPGRTCDGCVKCCEGWLEADVKGHKMHPGKPCFYLSDNFLGCSAYADRPKDPCIDYRCAWLDDESFPEAAKPSISGVLVTKRVTFLPGEDGMQKVDYYDVRRASTSVDPQFLEEIVSWLDVKRARVVSSDDLL